MLGIRNVWMTQGATAGGLPQVISFPACQAARPTGLAVTSAAVVMMTHKMQGAALVGTALFVKLCWQVQSCQPPTVQRRQFK